NDKEKTQLTFDVRMGGPGPYQVTAVAMAEGPLQVTKMLSTNVEAMADLQIEIVEDRRVVDVNQLTILRVTVTNRGSKDAAKLIISGRHSDNLEVTRTSGTDTEAQRNPARPTEFVFPIIERLPQGKSLSLGIEVKALKPGPATCHVYLQHGTSDEELPHED